VINECTDTPESFRVCDAACAIFGAVSTDWLDLTSSSRRSRQPQCRARKSRGVRPQYVLCVVHSLMLMMSKTAVSKIRRLLGPVDDVARVACQLGSTERTWSEAKIALQLELNTSVTRTGLVSNDKLGTTRVLVSLGQPIGGVSRLQDQA